MLPYGLAALFYGPLVRAYDARKIELFCIFIFALANLLAGFAADIQALFIARVLCGIFGASVIPLGLILIARHVESARRGRSVGIFFGAAFIASLLGLFLSGLLHWRWIFIIPALAGLLLWAAMYFYLPSFKPQAKVFKLNYLQAAKDKKTVYVFGYIFLISLFYHGVQQWLAVYFSSRYNFGQFIVSMLVMLTSLSGVFGEVIGGRLADSLGRARTINLGVLLMSISVLLLPLKAPLSALIVFMIIWGIGYTFNHAGISTVLTDFPEHLLNEAASLNSGVRFASGGLGVLLGGFLMQKSFNFGFIFFGLCFVSLLFVTLKLKKTQMGGIG